MTNSSLLLIPLVKLQLLIPEALFEIRYATENNFVGQVVYQNDTCYAHPDLVEPLRAVQQELQAQNLNIKIFDVYRSMEAQHIFWDFLPDPRYVSDPNDGGGRHTRGTAIDLTLVDAEGREQPMPTDFDDMIRRAHRDYMDLPDAAIANRQKLEDVMVKHGFVPFETEWWHFDLKGWETYPVRHTAEQTTQDPNPPA